MEKVVHKFSSFKEQEKFERDFWLKASPQEKFDAIETIRAIYISTFHPKINKIRKVVKKRKLNHRDE